MGWERLDETSGAEGELLCELWSLTLHLPGTYLPGPAEPMGGHGYSPQESLHKLLLLRQA